MDKTDNMMIRSKIQTLDMVYIAIGIALISVCSWISVPTAVPFTLQTFAVFLVLSLLGGKRGTIATVLYVILGTLGLPIFSHFTGGIGVILGSTGGYIVGFIFMGLIYMLAERMFGQKRFARIIALVIGLIVCYAFGTAWFMYVYTRDTGAVGLFAVLGWCVFPFIIPDIIKLVLALMIAKRVRPVIRQGV